jgi:hypothetical protein
VKSLVKKEAPKRLKDFRNSCFHQRLKTFASIGIASGPFCEGYAGIFLPAWQVSPCVRGTCEFFKWGDFQLLWIFIIMHLDVQYI